MNVHLFMLIFIIQRKILFNEKYRKDIKKTPFFISALPVVGRCILKPKARIYEELNQSVFISKDIIAKFEKLY